MVSGLLIKAAIKMTLAIPKTLGIPLNNLSILYWNMSPSDATLNGNHVYLYLPNGQGNVFKYDCSSNFRLWLLELTSVSVRYLTPASLGRVLLNIGPLCTGFTSTIWSLVESSNNYTLPLPFGTRTKLLHHSDISPISRGTIFAASVVCPAPS